MDSRGYEDPVKMMRGLRGGSEDSYLVTAGAGTEVATAVS